MKLVSSKPVGQRRVYDIEVSDVHNFYANGVNVHNCATDGGVSVIKDDGSVVDIVPDTIMHDLPRNIEITDNHELWYSGGNNYDASDRWFHVGPIPSSDITQDYEAPSQPTLTSGFRRYTAGYDDQLNGAQLYIPFDTNSPRTGTLLKSTKDHLVVAGKSEYNNGGVALVSENILAPTTGMTSHITSTYNTGWMNGDIKLATLSDTNTTDVTGTELVTNGTFDSDLSGWTLYGTTTPSLSAGGVLLTTGAVDGAIEQSISGGASGTYVISWDILQDNGGDFTLYINGGKVEDYMSSSSSYTYTGSISSIKIAHRYSGSGIIDNISVRPAEEDRSVNGNGLQVFGTVTKEPVATGADLVAYSGFSSDNYLQQPYNSDLDFGTGDFCYNLWVYFNSTSNYEDIIARGNIGDVGYAASEQGSFFLQRFPDDKVHVYYKTSDGLGGSGNTSVIPLYTWTMVTIVRVGNVLSVYINGTLSISGSNNVGGSWTPTSNQKDCTVRVGWQGSAYNYPAPATLVSLVRASATAPTAEQIAKIYEDEKVLFQEGAQATLYGSSDAVTALAYDEDTELLHVGTSAGRSDFSGLRRVGNTTDAVGSAISASNGMIVEE